MPIALYLVPLIQKGPIYSIWINSAFRIKNSNISPVTLFLAGISRHATSGKLDHTVMQSSVPGTPAGFGTDRHKNIMEILNADRTPKPN